MERINLSISIACKAFIISVLPLIISACGEKRTIITSPTPEQVILYTNVKGLPEGQSFVLQSDGIQKKVQENGVQNTFLVPQGEAFSIKIDRPAIDLLCEIENGEGIARGSDIRNIAIVCTETDSPPEIVTDKDPVERIYSVGDIVNVNFVINEYEGQGVKADVNAVKVPNDAALIKSPVSIYANGFTFDKRFPDLKSYNAALTFSADQYGLYEFKVTATDEKSSSEQVISVVLKPVPPSISAFDISPFDAIASDDLRVDYFLDSGAYEPSDLTESIKWYVNDTLVQEGRNKILKNDKYKGEDKVTVEVLIESKSEKAIVASRVFNTQINTALVSIEYINFNPSEPTSSQNLEAVYALNTKGEQDVIDKIETTFEWFVNSKAIAANNNNILAAENFNSGDSVSVRVSVELDGTVLAFDSSSTRVQRLEGSFVFSGLPRLIAEEEKVAFKIGWNSADISDEIVLRDAPEGATLSSEGEITWLAPKSKFGQQSYFFTFSSNEISQTVELQVQRRDDTNDTSFIRTLSLTESAGQNVHLLSSKGVIEFIEMNQKGMLISSAINGSELDQTWLYPYVLPDYADRSSRDNRVEVYDTNKDGINEIIVFTGQSITVFEGKTKQVLKSFSLNKNLRQREFLDFKVANIDADDDFEIIFLVNQDVGSSEIRKIYIIDDEKIQPNGIELATQALMIEVGNVDDDESLEIITNTGEVIDLSTRANQWFAQSGFGRPFLLADIDGNGQSNIIGLKRDSNQGKYQLAVNDAKTRTNIVTLELDFEPCSLMVGEFLVKDRMDISVASCGFSGSSTNYIYTLDSSMLTLSWSDKQTTNRFDRSSFYLSADIDGDGLYEILWGNDSFNADVINYVSPVKDNTIKTVVNAYGQLRSDVQAAGIYNDSGKQYAHFYSRENLDSSNDASRSGSLIQINNQMPLAAEILSIKEINDIIDYDSKIEIVDSDRDGSQEWLISNRSICASIDIKTKKELWRFSGSESCTNPSLSDIDGDGSLDLIFLRGQQLQVHSIKDMKIISVFTPDRGFFGRPLGYVAVNLDDDPQSEIIYFDSNNVERGLIKLDFNNGKFVSSASELNNSEGRFQSLLGLFDYNDDGKNDIIMYKIVSGPFSDNGRHSLLVLDQSFNTMATIKVPGRPRQIVVNSTSDKQKQLVVLMDEERGSTSRMAGLLPQKEAIDWLSPQIVQPDNYSFKDGFKQLDGSTNLMFSGSQFFMLIK